MNEEEIIKQLKEIVRPYAKNQEALDAIDSSTDFINDLKINSAHLVDVVLDIEEGFDIEIDNDSMEQMMTVQSTIDVIQKKLAEQESDRQ